MKRLLWVGMACLLSLPAWAEIPNSYRAERWEGSFRVIGLEGQSFTGDGGSKATVDDDIGFGFDMAYNLDEKLSLGFALEWIDTDFKTTTQPVAGGSAFDGRGDLEMTTMNVNGTYHFSARR